MIYVIATIDLVEGCRDRFLTAFRELQPTVRQEEGCIEYQATIDHPTNIDDQQQGGDARVIVVEKWECLDALEKHLIAPHMNAYRIAVKEMVNSVELQILEPA